MKIAILSPKSEFNNDQIALLESVAEVVFTETRDEHPIEKLLDLSKDADVIALDPDVCGGFEKAKENVITIMESLPNLKGVCLGTTSFGWIDLEYCEKKGIPVTNCPGWSKNSVAEQTIAFILNSVRRIILTDRETQEGKYKLEMASEVCGKTLGIIGLGSIGSRVAELAQGLGMKVIAYNRSPKSVTGVEMVSMDELLKNSDVISIHVTHSPDNENLITSDVLNKLKRGAFVVNLSDRKVVNEEAMAQAIQDKIVASYIFELESFDSSPLTNLPGVIMMKPFAWFTKEALDRLIQLWTENILAMAKGTPQHRIN